MRIVYGEHLQGRAVVDATGRLIGEVVEITIDADTWKVDGIRVKLRREAADVIGVHRGTFRAALMDISTDVVQSVGDAVVLRKDAASLREPLPPAPRAEPQPEEHRPGA